MVFLYLLLPAVQVYYLANIYAIVATLVILTAEIYFIGHRRVTKKSERKFGQFLLKRLLVFYLVAIAVSGLLVYLYGLYKLPQVIVSNTGVFNLVIIISLPCAIGAAIGDLLRKY